MLSSFDTPQTLPVQPLPFRQTSGLSGREHSMARLANDAFAAPTPTSGPFSQGVLYEQTRPSRDLRQQLLKLQQQYAILDRDDLVLDVLADEPALYALLIEAALPLRKAFGFGRVFQMRVQVSDDDRFIKVVVQMPTDPAAVPEQALSAFDANWWLENCQRSGGALVFDYEIQDVV